MALLGHGLRPRLRHGDSRGPARPWGAGSGQGHCGCSLWWLHVPGRRGVCQSCAASAVSCRPQVRAEAPARSRGRRCPASGCSPRGRPHAPCPPASPGSLHQPPGPSAPLSLSRRCPERGGDGHRLGSTRAWGQQEAPRVAPGRRSARLPPSRRVRVAEPALTDAGAPLLCVPPAHLPLAQPVARRSGPAPGSRVPVRGLFFPPSPAHVCARSHDTQLSGKEERVSPPPLPPPTHRAHADPSPVPDGPGIRTRGSGPGQAGIGTGPAR